DDIANIVEMPKSTVQSTIDRIKKTGSPLPTKQKGRIYKINKRSQRLLTRTIGDVPFVIYDRLRLELYNVDVNVCRQTVISSLKRMEHGSVTKRYDLKHTVPTKKYGGGGVMVW
ncbi:hypothetical protein BCV72DRAFT_182461, partial [Rhizopus microsporus var. microsporus]